MYIFCDRKCQVHDNLSYGRYAEIRMTNCQPKHVFTGIQLFYNNLFQLWHNNSGLHLGYVNVLEFINTVLLHLCYLSLYLK